MHLQVLNFSEGISGNSVPVVSSKWSTGRSNIFLISMVDSSVSRTISMRMVPRTQNVPARSRPRLQFPHVQGGGISLLFFFRKRIVNIYTIRTVFISNRISFHNLQIAPIWKTGCWLQKPVVTVATYRHRNSSSKWFLNVIITLTGVRSRIRKYRPNILDRLIPTKQLAFAFNWME